MAQYKKRKDGRYGTHVTVGKDRETGKAIRVPVYGRTEAELKNNIALTKADYLRGTFANDKGMSVGEYSMIWFGVKKGTVSAGTAKDYLNVINNHFNHIYNIKLKELTKTDVLKQINSETSDEFKRRIVITIKQILEAAIDDGLLYKNVARSIKQTIPKRKEKAILTPEEKEAIKTCDFEPMERLFVDILFACGLRRGEILALTKKSIDFLRGGISVTQAVSYEEENLLKAPKSESSVRFVPAPSWLMDELKVYCKELKGNYLIHGTQGQIMPDATYKRFWKRIQDKINTKMGGDKDIRLTKITPHTFRHNYATSLYYAGVGMKEAQKILGHSSIKVTMDIYTHLESNDDIRSKISLISF